MYPSIVSVKPLGEYRLELSFNTNETKVFDMKPYLDTGVFRQLKDESKFRSVRISFDTVEWEGGIDFDPEVLYSGSESVTEATSQQRS